MIWAMLRELRVENLALIEKLQLHFNDGLVVFTGETGAGKSIVLQAIHLLYGGRGATSWIRSGADVASVEALFEIEQEEQGLHVFLSEMGMETDEDLLVIRRTLQINGKSRFYVNSSLATAKMAGQLAEHLVSVASQHDHQRLLAPKNHLDIIDAVGSLEPQRAHFAACYDQWQDRKAESGRMLEQQTEKERRQDFLRFQLAEIEQAEIQPGEDEILIREKNLLKSGDALLRLGQEGLSVMQETVLAGLAQARSCMAQMAAIDAGLGSLSKETDSLYFQLEDQALQLRQYLGAIANDPERLEAVVGRIDLLQRLKRKYGTTLEALQGAAQEARQELARLDALDERQEELEREISTLGRELIDRAQKLSETRKKTAAFIVQAMRQELDSLCMEPSQFEVLFAGPEAREISHMTNTGWDRPEFMFSANPGEPVKPLEQVASGGELSRLMLAFRCLLARKDQVKTVIFDEVDAGIGGKAAETVARKIKELSRHHQVLCITHLPQIASYADEHLYVAKEVRDQRTITTVCSLAHEGRVAELTRMLDGDSVTQETVVYARALIARNQET